MTGAFDRHHHRLADRNVDLGGSAHLQVRVALTGLTFHSIAIQA
ncbi:MAG TPA: hypothetical protein VFN79_07215 [Steroidobacteraceae bacterium]|nr:hypothetical protein [Steroidobacteraceae bacterium]